MKRVAASKQNWVVLFRGLNVGGNHLVPMKALVAALEALGYSGVKTYLQSGNVLLQAPAKVSREKLEAAIADQLLAKHGFRPRVLALQREELQAAVDANPFKNVLGDPRTLHLFFLATKPTAPNLTAMNAVKTKTEAFVLEGRAYYLHTPDGFGKSKLAAQAEKLLGVDATARNWRTVTALLELGAATA
jgi:uncharacterized protein (DUF1697 family)